MPKLNNKQILYQGANLTLGRKLKLAIATGRKTTQLSIATSTLWILWIDIYEFVMISYHNNLTDIFITLQDSYAKIEAIPSICAQVNGWELMVLTLGNPKGTLHSLWTMT